MVTIIRNCDFPSNLQPGEHDHTILLLLLMCVRYSQISQVDASWIDDRTATNLNPTRDKKTQGNDKSAAWEIVVATVVVVVVCDPGLTICPAFWACPGTATKRTSKKRQKTPPTTVQYCSTDSTVLLCILCKILDVFGQLLK